MENKKSAVLPEIELQFSPVSITFDDGLRNQYDEFYPILVDFGIRATFYVVTGHIGRSLRMGWDELRDLHERGNEIGSHTHTHPHLSELPESEIDLELRSSRDVLRPFGCRTLAYPFGEWNPTVRDYAQRYYVAARGYYDYSTKGRDYGYNIGFRDEMHRLKVFPSEEAFPRQSTPLLELPLSKLQKVVPAIVDEGSKRHAWTIFVFHGRQDSIVWKLRQQSRLGLASTMRGLMRDLFRGGKLPKFRWMCEYLAGNDRIRVLTVSNVVDMIFGRVGRD